MTIILFARHRDRPRALCLHAPGVGLAACVMIALLGGLFAAGYWLGRSPGLALEAAVIKGWEHRLALQEDSLEAARRQTQRRIDALAARIGQLQAHAIRLNALGQRLTKTAGLDSGEFNFDQPPAQGGPSEGTPGRAYASGELTAALDALARELADRDEQLSALGSLMLHGNLQEQGFPAGRPILQGWLSSYYGTRTDPFSGRSEHHSGVDFAGKAGSDVIAVAAGVVTWSGPRYGYGKLVELDHGNGYVTRYAHNRENLVKAGDKVTKGQRIALMGSSGRSTGPHVHFEVLHNGRDVDPHKYIQSQR